MATPADVYAALSAVASSGELVPTTAPGAGRLLAAFGVTRLELAGGPAQPTSEGATLAATTTYLGASWSVSITGTASPAGMRLALRLELGTGQDPWTLGHLPNLPQSRVAGTGQAPWRGDSQGWTVELGGSIVTTPSLLTPLPVEQATMAATIEPGATVAPPLALEGWLTLSGTPLARYTTYLGTSRLRIGGTVTGLGSSTPPIVALTASAPVAQAAIAGARITEMGLMLRTDVPDAFAFAATPPTSAALLYAKVEAGTTDPLRGTLSAPLLQGDGLWRLGLTFENPPTLAGGVSRLLEFTGVTTPQSFQLPAGLPALGSFGIKELELALRPGVDLAAASLDSSAIRIESTADTFWSPPVPFVALEKVGTEWRVQWQGGKPEVTGSVYGTLRFGTRRDATAADVVDENGEPVRLAASVALPWLVVAAGNVDPIAIPLGTALGAYFDSSAPPDGTPTGITVERVRVEAAIRAKTYSGYLDLSGNWPVRIGKVTTNLDSLLLVVQVAPNRVTGRVRAVMSAKIDETRHAVFEVSAAYPGTGGWVFSGKLLVAPLDLLAFAQAFLGFTPSVSLPAVELTQLEAEYRTADGTYSASGALAARWTPEVLGLTLSLEARAAVKKRLKETATDQALVLAAPQLGEDAALYEGEISGTFRVNRLFVTVAVSFALGERVYRFEVGFGGASLRAVTRSLPNKTGQGKHQALGVSLHGLTLGKVVEELVALANPNANVHLEAPWSALNAIDLSAFTLVIDPTDQTIAVTYDVGLSLGFMRIDSVGLVYDRSAGQGSVSYQLTGTFLGESYDSGDPLSWDAVDEAAPEVPGKGPRLFELRFLGVGQHVTLSKLTEHDSVGAVLAALREEMVPVTDPDESPLEQSSLRFDESSGWMVGFDATIMDAVTLGVVLHDPDLYGLVVKLGGENAGTLKGLEFELLYKKVTNSIGVFRVRLQIPDAFRQIFLGPVSITLGIVTVDVFTNGNFVVDLGFPHGADFTPSFGVQAGPFIGSGGVYFGLLEGATSKRVPAITNGTFSPVLELGVGLAVGVGRTFEKGLLKAGAYVQVVAIVEGVLAWFRPTNAAAPAALYYWARGTAGIIGRVYGEVDFKIVRVRVNVEARALVTLELAAHRAAHVELDVGVSVEAKIKILFVTISYSFEMRLRESFTIGSDEAAPWTLGAGQTARDPLRLLDNVAVPHRRRPALVRAVSHAAFLDERHGEDALVALGGPPPYDLVWPADLIVFPDGNARRLDLRLLPAYTVDAVPVHWPGLPAPPAPPAPSYAIAFVATAQAPDVSPRGTTFSVFVEAMLRWSLAALGIDPISGTVTAGQLVELQRQLELPETAEDAFAYKTLSTFLAKNVIVRVDGIPQHDIGPVDGVAFPMPPALAWQPHVGPSEAARDFATFNPVDATYERELAEQLGRLDPGSGAPEAAQARADALGDPPEGKESLATFVFRDYALMVTRAAVQAAIDVMADFPYTVTGGETLDGICTSFGRTTTPWTVRAGDDVDAIAHALGVSDADLLALNPGLEERLREAAPGARLAIALGTTAEAIAAANPSWPLAPGRRVPLGELPHHVADGATLGAIAGSLGSDADAWLRDPRLLGTAGLLREGAPLAVPRSVLPNDAHLPLDVVAAELYVRMHGTADLHLADEEGVPLLDWYVGAIGELNPGLPPAGLPDKFLVPRAFDDLSDPTVHVTMPGDALLVVAATYAVVHHRDADEGFLAWLRRVRAINPPGPPGEVHVPAETTAIGPGERLGGIAERLPLRIDGLDTGASFRRLVRDAPILAPLALVTVPGCTGTTVAGDTIERFAQRYGVSPEAVGAAGAAVPGLLAAGDGLVVPHPGSVPIGGATPGPVALVPAVLARAGSIGGQVSRFLMHGFRAKAPEAGADGRLHPTGPAAGLFALTGQQIPGPPPRPSTDPALTLELHRSDPDATWLELAGPGDTLTIALTGGDLSEGYPWDAETTKAFEPDVLAPPAPLPAHADVPVRHDLQQRILWQTTSALALPAAAGAATLGGMPTVWPFPTGLLASVQRLGGSKAFELARVDPQLGPAAEPVALSGFAWGTRVAIALRSVPGQQATYEVLGADTAGREVLLELWRYLQAAPATEDAAVHLAWSAPESSGLAAGLASTPADPDATFLVKTNLSTETHSGMRAAAFVETTGRPAPTDFSASSADAEQFVGLLWECSVVGGGGYWLRFADRSGAPLPDAVFGPDGTGELSLVVLLRSATTASPVDRTIRSFMNCAVVGEHVDASAATLFARVADGSETIRRPTLRPGEAGFGLTLRRPPEQDGGDRVTALRALYSLVGFEVRDTPVFAGAGETLPLGPAGSADSDRWRFEQVIPVARLAKRHGLPRVEGLPAPERDPYAGINDAGGPATPAMAETKVALTFHDVLGNASAGAGEAGAGGPLLLPVPVGYTDAVIGVGAWPATTSGFTVLPATATSATLAATVTLQPAAHLPSRAQRGSAAAGLARADGERFSDVYLQLMQPDVRAALLTTLEARGDHDPISQAVPMAGLRAFATGAVAWLGTAAALVDVPIASATAEAACARSGFGYGELAAANGEVSLAAAFAQEGFVVPRYALARAGASIADLAPDDAAAVLANAENAVLPLRPQSELVVPASVASVPPDPAPPALPPTFAALAAEHGLTSASLVRANVTIRGLLRAGAVLDADGIAVVVPQPAAGSPTASLDDLAATLAPQGVPWTGLVLGAANDDVPGLLAPGAPLTLDRRLTADGETLARNATGLPAATLAPLNAHVPDLFVAGSPVEIGTVAAAEVAALFASRVSLDAAAARYGITTEQLVRRNRTVALVANALAAPGQAQLPNDMTGLSLPYPVTAGASLASLADRAAMPTAGLATMNDELPDLLAAGVSITLPGGQTATTRAGDSLAALRARLGGVSPSDLADAIAERTDVLAPAARVTFTQAATAFGLTPRDLALANVATAGLLAPGVDLVLLQADGTTPVAGRDGRPAKVTTGEADTLNGVIWRFAQLGVETDAGAIAASNAAVPLLVAFAQVLLAPAPVTLTAPLGKDGWKLPGAVFPIHAWLEVARAPQLVAAGLRGDADDGPAVRDRTALAAVPAPGAADRALALGHFAEQVERAIAPLRIATGRVLEEEREVGGTDLWAVAFMPELVEKVIVEPASGDTPRFYGLRPLNPSLVSRSGVAIRPLRPDGRLGPAAAADIQGVDLETWAARVLDDIELLASAPYATGAWRVDALALARVLTAKGQLAEAIADGLDYVVGDDPDPARSPVAPADWASAREQLRQRLLVSLSDGYTADAIVQYQATVNAPFAHDAAARLVGPVLLPGEASGDQRRASVTAGKTSLVRGTSYVDLVVTMAEEGTQRSVPLPLTAAPNELEFDVEQVAGGYASSKWLRFVRDLAGNLPPGVAFDLGTPQVPLPLRAYPSLPALLGQTATATHPEPQTVGEAVRWDYGLRFQHQSRAQDELELEVLFNESAGVAAPGTDQEDLVAALAQYAAVADDLWTILRALPEAPSVTAPAPPALAAALGTFATLLETVAERWREHWGAPGPAHAELTTGRLPEAYRFTLRLTTRQAPPGAREYATVELERTAAGGTLEWPSLAFFTDDGGSRELGPPTGTGNVRTYAFPAGVEAFALLGFEMRFGGLHVAERQNARASVRVVRNARLLDGGPRTRDGFIYRTPTLSFPAAAAPSLAVDAPLAIGRWSDAVADTPLGAVFAALFGDDASDRDVALAIRYGFELGGSSQVPIVTYLPVALRPRFTFDQAATVQQILAEIAAWREAQAPSTTGGEWVFALTMFSSVDGRRDQPLVSLSALTSPLA